MRLDTAGANAHRLWYFPSVPIPPDRWIAACSLAAAVSVCAAPLLARNAPALRLVDHPGGRKQHARAVPLVGGLSIFVGILFASLVPGGFPAAFYLGATILILVGAYDDAVELRPRTRFAAQIVAATVMITLGGVELRSVGDLIGTGPIGLWVFALPMTVFAVVGVINSLNMLDGMDGLGGSVSFISLAWYAVAAQVQGLPAAFSIAALTAAAVAGFLVYNLRFPWQPHARIFLGDAGSMMLGFVLAWLAVDLTQGPGRTFPPICALWIVLLPLADCVSLMTRRLASGRSPFTADNRHVHHYLQELGHSPTRSLAILAAASSLFGGIGVVGWLLKVPEHYLFWAFFVAYFMYHFWIQRAWRRLEQRDVKRATRTADEEEDVLPAA
jgi:UDP-GlcNAc:undecaprenyl-phosphate GlcNAc-1-phosphate transferase